MKTLVLARHGESTYNVERRINSDPSVDCPLTEAGLDQARRLARLLPDDIEVCVTSSLPRAIETARIATEGRNLPTLVVTEFNEPAAGILEGAPVDDYLQHLTANGYLAPNPGGGESQVDALERFLEGFRLLLNRDEERILAVVHGMPIAWLRQGVLASGNGEQMTPPDHNRSYVRNNAPALTTPDFRDPFVEFAEPYSFEVADVERGIESLTTWVSGQRRRA